MNGNTSAKSIISSIGIAPAKYAFNQTGLLTFMQNAYNDHTTSRKLNILFKQSGIKIRHSILPDFDYNHPSPLLFIDKTIPNLNQRLTFYKNYALPLAIRAINDVFVDNKGGFPVTDITHIITISCTGMYAPGLATELIEYYGLPAHTFQTAINFMGCNAAFAGMRIADLIVSKDTKAKVLVVCVELCTIHFQPKDDSNNLLANTLFGDGAAAFTVINQNENHKCINNSLAIDQFCSLTLKEGKDLMAWNINTTNFEMVLSAGIPDFIGENIYKVIQQLKDNYAPVDLSKMGWAIHPGGKKILDVIKNTLQLKEGTLEHSYKVLEGFGNMSSVTILFVLHRFLYDSTIGQPILSMGFGPGISIESALLTKIVYPNKLIKTANKSISKEEYTDNSLSR